MTSSMQTAGAEGASQAIDLDPISLVLHSTGPVLVVVWSLIVAAVAVWFVLVLKLLQLRRWSAAEHRFERDAAKAEDGDHLVEIARAHSESPGARVVTALGRRRGKPHLLEATAKRAVVDEERRATSLLSLLASIGSASPFIGLFGTVYGIMEAFLLIGKEKSASLPVVAPAIGEALIATAIGLFAAIPAVIAYNSISKRVDDLLAQVEASSDGWVALLLGQNRAMTSAPAERRPAY
ncbi:MAG: MotA/TolQ/ExbB proton channel family protein [Myxococcota bacterium]